MIAESIRETVECCREMIREANVHHEHINCILLVGGSCRIPYVRETLRKEFGRPIYAANDLELVVCEGAAMYSARNEKPQKKAPKEPPVPPVSPASPPQPKEVKTGDVIVPRNPWDFMRKQKEK